MQHTPVVGGAMHDCIVKAKFCWVAMISSIIALIGAFPCEACPLNVDPSLAIICNSIDSAFKKQQIGVSPVMVGGPASFNIERNGKVDIASVMLVVDEAAGKAVEKKGNYSFYIQDLNLAVEDIAKTEFKCRIGKCVKVAAEAGPSTALSELSLTAYSEKAAAELVESIEILRRMFGVPTIDLEPIRLTCGNFDSVRPSVRITGEKGDLFEIHHRGRVIYTNFPESREWMGGARDQLTCDDIKISRDVLVIRLGWKNDLLMAFAFQKDITGRVAFIWKYSWPIRDGEDIDISITDDNLGGDDVLIRYGRNHDLLARLCFSQQHENWRRSEAKLIGAGIPDCDNRIVQSTKISAQ